MTLAVDVTFSHNTHKSGLFNAEFTQCGCKDLLQLHVGNCKDKCISYRAYIVPN